RTSGPTASAPAASAGALANKSQRGPSRSGLTLADDIYLVHVDPRNGDPLVKDGAIRLFAPQNADELNDIVLKDTGVPSGFPEDNIDRVFPEAKVSFGDADAVLGIRNLLDNLARVHNRLSIVYVGIPGDIVICELDCVGPQLVDGNCCRNRG